MHFYLDLDFYLVFTFCDVIKKKEKKKLEEDVVAKVPSLKERVFFVSNCIAGQKYKVEHRLKVIRVLEAILGGYKPPDDSNSITKLRKEFDEVPDDIDATAPDEEQNTHAFVRALGDVLGIASLPVVRRKLNRIISFN